MVGATNHNRPRLERDTYRNLSIENRQKSPFYYHKCQLSKFHLSLSEKQYYQLSETVSRWEVLLP